MSRSQYHRHIVLFVAVAVVSAGAFVPATAVVSASGGGGRSGRFPWDCRDRTSGIIRPRPRGTDATTALGEVGQDAPSSKETDASTNSGSASSKIESVHLQLKSPAMMASMRNGDDNNNNNNNGDGEETDRDKLQSDKEPEDGPKLIKFRTYRSAPSDDDAVIMYSLGLPLRKFKLFIHANTGTNVTDICDKQIATEDVDLRDSAVRERMRNLWQSGANIITDRTEFLAVYESERNGADDEEDTYDSLGRASSAPSSPKRQRGDFADLLSMYVDRLVGIIVDEQDEEQAAAEKARQIQKMMQRNMTEAAEMERNLKDGVSGGLVGYLKREYGEVETDALVADNLLASGRTKEEQYATMQKFLDWFRQRFPYYYDRCGNCGASAKEDNYLDPSCRAPSEDEGRGENEGTSQDDSNETLDCPKDAKDDGTTFLGYVYPDEQERQGKAGRTEVYCCHKCGAISRFPRYNSASSVLRSRVGRCGEYSMLILRFFRALGYEARWVVDWSDHVWAEIRMCSGDWIHVDPCEAAIDNPLLYESWGKKQTHIVAFHPSIDSSHAGSCIEDVTTMYTSDNTTAIEERREDPAELIETSLVDTRKALQTKLRDVLLQQQQSSPLDAVHAEST